MSRYEWPRTTGRGKRRDDPAARAGFNARRRLEFDPEGARRASRAPQEPGGRRRRAPANGRTHLWQPLGPVTLLRGQAEGRPRVSGRVNALAVHPDGLRIYAASANGGVWYSSDGGANWVSVAGLATTNTAGIVRPAQRNACGAIHVEFGAAEGDDLVFLGTGEVAGEMAGHPADSEGGIGILIAARPLQPVRPDPWIREAPNLVNDGIYAFAREPGGTITIAATLTGLYERPAAAAAESNWVRPASTPFDTLNAPCTDVLWTPANALRPARLWVWVESGANFGLWVRDDVAGNFTKVAVAAALPFPYTQGRASLAASTPATQVWVLNDRGAKKKPALFRVTNPAAGGGAPVAHGVIGVPDILHDQGFYDIAMAVDPAHPDRVALGGSYLEDSTADGSQAEYNAAIVVADVAPNPGNGNKLTYGHPARYTMIGIGVHPDVHALAWSNGGASLWAACDGGVFRSDAPARPAGFYSRNNGLAISESNYAATHPRCEGHIIAGLQDNGTVTRLSSGVWTLHFEGDGGGVVLNAAVPDRWISQYVRGSWNLEPSVGTGPLVRAGTLVEKENEKAAFYSMPASIAHVRLRPPRPPVLISQTLVGTYRLWYSDDFGARWVTLPSGRDPLPGNLKRDDLGQPITVCRWQSPDVAWALCDQLLTRFARTPGSHNAGGVGTWISAPVMPPVPAIPPSLLDSRVWTDIAVNLDAPPAAGQPPAQHGALGAMYIGTVGNPGNAAVDTLYWFDGTNAWHPTVLRAAVPAPVTAIVCNPDAPAEVWAGTTVGVWHGTRVDHGAAPPTWNWVQKVNGLPEATVEDLALFSDRGLVLLRAAIASRGVWELRLDVPDVPELTYVRCHDDDLRHRPPPAVGGVRELKKRNLRTDRSWHGSPDIRPRVAPAVVPAPSTLPWQRGTLPLVPGTTEKLRRFQAALRSSTNDPRIVANGVWDTYFSEVLRDHNAPTVAGRVRINQTYWNLHMTGAHATAEPWGNGTPSEADLYELTPQLTEGDLPRTSCSLPRRPCKIDVVVHHRGLNEVNGGDVRVTLLSWIDPVAPPAAKWDRHSTWFAGNVAWTPAVNEVLNSVDGKTLQTVDNGWSFVLGTNIQSHRKTLAGQKLDPTHAGIVTFDFDASGFRPNLVVLLVAVIRTGTTAAANIALAPATLQELALTSPNVAVRSLRII